MLSTQNDEFETVQHQVPNESPQNSNCHNAHNGDIHEFEMKILTTYGRDNTTIKANEAMRINEHNGVKLNSKAEYRQPKVPRIVIENRVNSS